MDTTQETEATAAPKKKTAATGNRRGKCRGGDPHSRSLSPAAPPVDGVVGPQAALAECAAACCVLCACLPVGVLCCMARAPLRLARRCCRWRWRRRPRRRLAPGGSSSSFSDAEVGDFRHGRRRAMPAAEEKGERGARSRRGRRRTPPPQALPQQSPPPLGIGEH